MGSAYCTITTTAANYLSATVNWDSGPEVTVSVYTTAHEWRLKKRGYSGNTGIVYGPSNSTSEEFTFNADDGGEYIFQALDDLSYQYENGSFATSGFTVNFGDDEGGNDGDDDDEGDDSGGGSSSSTYKFYINKGTGTDLEVIRTWNETTGEQNWDDEIPSGTTIVQKDYFTVYATALEGYENITVNFNNFLVEDEWEDEGWIGYSGKMQSPGNIEVSSRATLKEYKLSATAGIGSYITVARKSSKKSGASLGVLSNGATIYHFDTLEISVGVEAGYDIVDTIVTGCTENDDGTFTVIGDVKVTVATKLTGLVYIDNGTSFVPCLIFIDNGVNWVQCIPYIDNGTSWVLCS